MLTYLDIEREHFYRVETTVDGASFVTARGWDDLSAMIKLYEEQQLPVDELLISQYVQNAEIAQRFSMYYDLFTKYRADYQIDRILSGSIEESVIERARAAGFDERVSLMGLITDALGGRLREAVLEERAVAFTHERLAALRDALSHEEEAEMAGAAGMYASGAAESSAAGSVADGTAGTTDVGASAVFAAPAASPEPDGVVDVSAKNTLPLLRIETTTIQQLLATERAAGLLSDEKYLAYERTLALINQAMRAENTRSDILFSTVKDLFAQRVALLDELTSATSQALDNAFRFTESAFGDGQEMLLLITDLSVNRYGMAFINAHGCERYFANNEKLLFSERGSDLIERINRLNLTEE